jgi:spore germination protein GerM
MSRHAPLIAAAAVFVVAAAFVLLFVVPRWYAPKAAGTTASTTGTPAAPERKITATLYFVAEDGLSLVGVKREVPFGDPVVEQARRLVEAQLGAAPAPLLASAPAGTTLRALFLTERGDAFVDLSAEVTTRHTGGSLNELFTVYAIVDALTVNLPAITRVQILVEGKEVDTIAGHVDVRHPLQKNLKWVTDH